MSEPKDIKTKSELMDSFVQIAIAKGYSDYDGEAERFINETVDMYSNLPQPQLTIPKSIADELDKVEMNWNTLKDEAQGWPTDDLIMWLDDGNNPLMFAYLAGKALGVDLVKVVEG